MPRLVALASFAAVASLGCARVAAEGVRFGLQHTVGVTAGPCPQAMDSVAAARGAPSRRYRSDEEDRATETQVFWHEWAYRLQAGSDGRPADSVEVVGFWWGSGVVGCEVHARYARVPGPRGLPWVGAGDVPQGR